MAYYYITANKDVWKSCGARKVRKIWRWMDIPKPDSLQWVHAFSNNESDKRLPKILIPMVRRVFPELITSAIVGVQPMSGPVGAAFALRYRYVDSKKTKFYQKRMTMPIWRFKKQYNVTFESKYWATILFELNCME